MTVSSLYQLQVLMYGALAGVVCAGTASLVKGLGQELRLPSAVRAVLDLLLWVFAGGVVVWFSLSFGDGSVSGYQILAAVCGFLLYWLCLGRITEKGARLLGRLLRLIFAPAAFLLRGVKLYIEKIYKNLSSVLCHVHSLVKRSTSAAKTRKKIQKNYKKML